jgi:hypothetical protein
MTPTLGPDEGEPQRLPLVYVLADLARPAIYGRSWMPWLRLVLLLAVVAVVLIAARALLGG